MCSIWDGLVICLRLFFMLHLPLFGCSKIPGTLYWFSRHDVKRRTELVGIVPGSECWHREGRFLHSHALPPQCVSCSLSVCYCCQLPYCIGGVTTPSLKKISLARLAARRRMNCSGCLIQTNLSPKTPPLTSSQKSTVTQSGNRNLESIHSDKTSESFQHDLITKEEVLLKKKRKKKGEFQMIQMSQFLILKGFP